MLHPVLLIVVAFCEGLHEVSPARLFGGGISRSTRPRLAPYENLRFVSNYDPKHVRGTSNKECDG